MSEPTPPPAAPAAPPKSGNRTLVIVLCLLLGLLLLIGGCVATCTYIVSKKAREYAGSAKKNPAYATLSLLASLHPGVEVVSKDEASGKITLRNKKTGEVVTLNTGDYTADNIGAALEKFSRGLAPAHQEAEVGPKSTAEPGPEPETPPEKNIPAAQSTAMAASLKSLPAYLPAYPGATTVEAKSSTVFGASMHEYAALTTDKPDDILEYYEKKLIAAGYTIAAKSSDTNEHGPVASLNAMLPGPMRTVTLSAASEENGRVRINLNYTELAK